MIKPNLFLSLVRKCFKSSGGGGSSWTGGRRRNVVFLGDSRIRQIYKSLVRLISLGLEPEEYAAETPKEHHSLNYGQANFAFHFYWAPEPENIIETVRSSVTKSVSKSNCREPWNPLFF